MFTLQEIESLNELEFIICEYIQKNKQLVSDMTIRELANNVHVSTTTVLRLCKKFNCDGYAEFKIKLKMYIDSEMEANKKSDKVRCLEFLDMLDKEHYVQLMELAAKKITNADRVIFVGDGINRISAKYGAEYFTETCKLAFYVDNISALKKYDSLRGSVLIVISEKGKCDELVKCIEDIRKLGVIVISITNSHICKVSELSHINIPYYAEVKTVNFNKVGSGIYTMYILEKIAANILEINSIIEK